MFVTHLLTVLMSIQLLATGVETDSMNASRYCTYNSIHTFNDGLRSISTDYIYEIKVVFHVVYNSDEQNISDGQIESQIAVLNQDFRKRNSDISQLVDEFSDLSADTNIQFKLAELAPNGEETNGINRYATDHQVFANNDIFYTALGGYDGWDQAQYLNVWIADLASGILGYASSPDEQDEEDGIVLSYQVVGREGNDNVPYHLGRTLTHEVGHYLGLSHLWGTGGCSSDDNIEDTPNQESATHSCDLSSSSCGTTDMVQNFMNLVDDECMLFFTSGQANLMRSSLELLRPTIWNVVDDALLSAFNEIDTPIDIYPNPVRNGYIHLANGGNSRIQKLSILGINGEVQFEIHGYDLSNDQIDINNLSSGLYLAIFQTDDQTISKKVVISSS